VAWSEPIPIAGLRRIGQAADATVNDVLLAAVAGSLRSYSLRGRRPLPAIRVTVPYNLRPLDRAEELGNGFSLVYLDLPVAEASAQRRLSHVRQAMRAIKASPQPWVTFAVLNSVGLLPVPLQKLAINFFGSKASAVITNVPGPKETVYLAGRPIRQALFWEPESAGIGLGVSIFSYAGEVVVGVIADARLVPDPHRIVDQIPQELARLKPSVPARPRAVRAAPAPHRRSRPAAA
jgi:diacylglycerol O-acyltransferase / wax synthase